MKVLVLNCGSSSVKYELFESDPERSLADGVAERVGAGSGSALHHRVGDAVETTAEVAMPEHRAAIGELVAALTSGEGAVLESLDEVGAVGHRVVHGGEGFSGAVLIDEAVIEAIEECCELAPLHNPPNLVGIRACQDLMPGTPQVAVFDTAFHQTIPRRAHLYGLPYDYYEKYGLRRYGFHGTSHRYVTLEAADVLRERGPAPEQQRIVTCHLGNGCSMAAVRGGESMDTTMGFTPLEGLLMGTRCGDLDATVPLFLMEREGLGTDDLDDLLNKSSGLLGLSGVSNDLRDVLDAADDGNDRAGAAIDVFCYRVRKYIGAYAACLGGLDAIVFTAGIGEGSPRVRAESCSGLEFLGIAIDPARNEAAVRPDKPIDISEETASGAVLVVPTDEELMIARDTAGVLASLR
ncbi:MAG: acetate kinase [Armatimonadota bacterium]|jgi:acetate kinase